MNIQLSISLLASDRPSALERCLDSLAPLLIQLPSELIIVHTGIKPGIHELACRYTDLVIPYIWCNDFSAARNVGIKAAKGEWFLYIDDDEWFEDTSEICDFFQSGEYRRYGMACYRQRNYFDWSGTSHTDFQAMRMLRVVPGIHFQNPVHEEPTPLSGPCRYFNTYVHHYGYVQTPDYNKTSRNLLLLKKDAEDRPGYVKNYIQLVQEYVTEENWSEAENSCRKGLELYKNKAASSDTYLNWLQSEAVELLYLSKSYHSVEKKAFTILNDFSPCELVMADIYATLTLSCTKCRDSVKTLQFGLKFEEILEYIEQNPRIWTEQNYGSLCEDKIKNPKRLYELRMACLEAALDIDDQIQAAFFFLRLPWDSEYQLEWLYPELDRLDRCFHEQFTALLNKHPSNSLYQVFHNAIHMKGGQKEQKQFLFRCITESKSDYLKQRAVKEMISSGTDLNAIVCRLELDTWGQYLAAIVKDLSDLEAQQAWRAGAALEEKHLFYKLILKKELLGRALARGYYTGEKFMETLSAYADSLLSFYKMQYQDEMFFQENLNFLPGPCRFALLISEAVQKIEDMKYADAIHLLQSALPLEPAMSGVINELIRQMAKKMGNPVYNAGDEFRILAKQMKEALGTMLKNKQYQEALSIITQLLPLLPEDLELLRLRQKLLRDSIC